MSTAEYVDGSDTALFGSVGKFVKKAVSGAAKGVSSAAKTAAKGASTVTKSPIWNIAQTGASFIPGVGQAVSSGMAAAAALGRGESAKDIALAAARGAVPGGPAAQAAFDVAVGAIKGQRLDRAALAAVREQVPGGELGRAAFDAGVAMATGTNPETAVMSAAQRAAMQSVLAAGRRVVSSAGPLSLPHLSGPANSIARALASDAVSRGLRASQVAQKMGGTSIDARNAIAGLLMRHAGRGVSWKDIGEGETVDQAARRLGVQLPANLSAPAPSAARVSGVRVVSVPPVGLSRNALQRIFASGTPELRKAILAHGLLSEIARNTGELGSDGKWTVRTNEFPSTVAKLVTGDANRWHELPAVNPGMKEVHKKDSSGKIIWSGLEPWYTGLRVNLPPGWVAPTLPQLTTPAPASAPTSSSSSVPGGPPFSPPSQYPEGYPSPIYVVQAGDYGTKIAERITGVATRWKELLAANPTTADPKYGMKLGVGQKLTLPASWVKQTTVEPVPPLVPGVIDPAATSPGQPTGGKWPPDPWWPLPSPGYTPPTASFPPLPEAPKGEAAPPIPIPTSTPATPATPASSPPAAVSGTPQQIASIQVMLGYFYKAHSDATWSIPDAPFGSTPADYTGAWTERTTKALAGFQNWWNTRGKTPKLATNGQPDPQSVAALRQQIDEDLGQKMPGVPPAPQLAPPGSVVAGAPPKKDSGIAPLLLAASIGSLLLN